MLLVRPRAAHHAWNIHACMTRVINIADAPEWWERDPSYVYIGRGRGPGMFGLLGNPHRVSSPCPVATCEGVVHNRTSAIAAFEVYLSRRMEDDPDFARAVRGLKGKVLVCPGPYCGRGKPCHGDVYVRRVES